jgi:hypothetical protein
MRPALLLALAWLAAPCIGATAQTPTLPPGARVRVTAPAYGSARQVGTVLALRGDTLVLQTAANPDTLLLPWSGVTGLEVSRGRRRQVREGIGFGFLAGAAFGMLIGLADGDDPPDSFIAFSAGEKALFAGAVLGGIGAVVGGVLGAASPTDRWERVPLRSVEARVGAAPGGHGLALSLSARF